VWWVDGGFWLRIASLDKRFVVAYALGRASDQPAILTVHGHEFPGLEPSEPRPIYLKTLELAGTSMGGWVEQLLGWSFEQKHELTRADGPPRFP
jgi:hypothetical protein